MTLSSDHGILHVYRDLKPENVLVREEGHIMISDFDLSFRCAVSPTLVKSSFVHAANPSATPGVLLDDDHAVRGCMPSAHLWIGRHSTSMSFVGIHEYLAPEIIRGEGHGSAVDWWTFGIFLYKLLHGMTPFKGSGNKDTLFNVAGQPLKFPESPRVSYNARDLIRGFLVKEPHKRNTYKIKQHPFFEGVNWVLGRSAMPPYIPETVDFTQFASKDSGNSDKKIVDIANEKNKSSSTDSSYVEFEYF